MNVYTLWVLRHVDTDPELVVAVAESTEEGSPGAFALQCSAALAGLEGNVVSAANITIEVDAQSVLRVLRSDHALLGRVVEGRLIYKGLRG